MLSSYKQDLPVLCSMIVTFPKTYHMLYVLCLISCDHYVLMFSIPAVKSIHCTKQEHWNHLALLNFRLILLQCNIFAVSLCHLRIDPKIANLLAKNAEETVTVELYYIFH